VSDLLAVDPGSTALGWAMFRDGALYTCSLLRAKRMEEMLLKIRERSWPYVSELVVERPQIYKAIDSKADPNRVTQLSIIAGAAIGSIEHSKFFLPYPAEWKGQIPKDIHHKRLRKHLSEPELEVLDCDLFQHPKSLRHNILDAVGLGIWRLSRKGKSDVIIRQE